MTEEDEALKLALEALDNLMYWDNGKPEYDEARQAITAIKEALAQPEQKRVAFCKVEDVYDNDSLLTQLGVKRGDMLYTTPPQPEQEPVDSDEKAGAYMEARLWEFIDMAAAWPKASPDPRTWDHVMVYAPNPAQRTWVGLTDEEQTQVAWSCGAMSADWLDFARAIEAKLKEKNT